MRLHSTVLGAIAGALAFAGFLSGADAMARFPTVVTENTTAAGDTAYTGAPDGTAGALANNRVTYDLGADMGTDVTGFAFNVYELDSTDPSRFPLIDVLVSSDGTTFVSVPSSVLETSIQGDEAHSGDENRQTYFFPDPSSRFVRVQGLAETGEGFLLDAIGALVVAVPEPPSVVLLAVGAAWIGIGRLRRRR